MSKILHFMSSLRQNTSCKFDLLEHIAAKVNEQDKDYEYFVAREHIKRIDKNGNIKVILTTNQNRAKINYFFELESFIKKGLEKNYEDLEDYYEKNGYTSIGWRISLSRRKKSFKKREEVIINLSALQKETLQKIANDEGVSLSQLCQKALKESGWL